MQNIVKNQNITITHEPALILNPLLTYLRSQTIHISYKISRKNCNYNYNQYLEERLNCHKYNKNKVTALKSYLRNYTQKHENIIRKKNDNNLKVYEHLYIIRYLHTIDLKAETNNINNISNNLIDQAKMNAFYNKNTLINNINSPLPPPVTK